MAKKVERELQPDEAARLEVARRIKSGRLTPEEMRLRAFAYLDEFEKTGASAPVDSAKAFGPQLVHVAELEAEVAEMRKRRASGQLAGLSCGYASVDKLIGGIVPGEMIMVAGKTSHGKSQFAQNVAYRVATSGTPVLFVTLEQTRAEVADRWMSMHEFRTGSESMAEVPLILQGKPDLQPEEVDPLITAAMQDGVGLVILDHLHMWIRGEDATGKGALISQAVKQAALRHEVPIMALAQLRKTNGHYPTVDDVKDSVVLSQDADVILLVHRPKMDDGEAEDEFTVAVHKNRNRGFDPSRNLATLQPRGIALLDYKRPKVGPAELAQQAFWNGV